MLNKPAKIFILIPTIIAPFFWACGSSSKITIPANDRTPPAVSMLITSDDHDGIRVNQHSRGDTLETRDDVVNFLVIGTDSDGGIKKVALWATYAYSRGSVQQGPLPATAPVKASESQARVGDSVSKSRSIGHEINLRNELGTWSSLKVEVWARAENFHGARAQTPVVIIRFPR